MKVWRLLVWNVGPEYAGLMARLKMMPGSGLSCATPLMPPA